LRAPLQCTSGVGGAKLHRRIEAILAGSIGRTLGFKAVCLLFAAAISTVGAPIVLGLVTTPAYQTTATFEVASIRVNKSGQLAMPSRTKGRLYTATNIALRNVIAAAYGIPTARVLGGPSWIGAVSIDMRFVGGDRFDISAT